MSSSPTLSFREFLKAKAEEYGVRDRHRLRDEWLAAVNQLLAQLQEWLQQADPEGLLDIIRYKVARTEQGLGTYDAPAMKIRFGPGEVDVVPMSRGLKPPNFPAATGPRSSSSTPGSPTFSPPSYGGRVDLTDGYRKYNLYRNRSGLHDVWEVPDDGGGLNELTSGLFEQIVQDLLS